MEELRRAYGKERLGRVIRQQIADKLRGMGLRTLPAEIPDRQWATVRIFKMGTPVEGLIDAVLNPSEQGDDRLRSAASGSPAEQLEQIREIVSG